MDSSRRRALRLSAGSALALALPFPFAASRAANRPPKIALVMKSLANEFFLTMENGARAHQKTHASEYTLLANGIRDETDTGGQIRLIEQMIVARVDALVLAPADSKALVPVVRKAVDAGILVVNIDNRLDPETLRDKGLNVPFVGPDNRKGARLVGEFVAKSLKPGDAIGIIEGIPTTTNAQQRTAGFRDAAQARGSGSSACNRASGKSTRATRWPPRCCAPSPTSRPCCAATTTWRSARYRPCAPRARPAGS